MMSLFAQSIRRDISSKGPPERQMTRFSIYAVLKPESSGGRRPERTGHIHQDSPRFRDDDRPGGDVPAVDPDLEEGLHSPRGHEAHVSGGRPRPAQPAGTTLARRGGGHTGVSRAS